MQLPLLLLAFGIAINAESAPGFPVQVSTHLSTYFDYSQRYVDADTDRHVSITGMSTFYLR